MTMTLMILAAVLAPDDPSPAPAKVTYYLGSTKVESADGRSIGHMASLVKREVIPSESKIVETVLRLSSKPGSEIKEIVAVLNVTGSKFTVKEKEGGFIGDGELTGEPWKWTAWNSTSKIPGPSGGTVKSRDKVTDRGMAVTKEVLGDDGAVRVRLIEDYVSIDGSAYDLLRAKLLPK
jgi:hypothetical protein